MLVLSRDEGQSIQVGDTLVTVKELRKNEVLLELSGEYTRSQILKKNEHIQFGDNTIVVVEIRNLGAFGGTKKVRLGVEAPKEVPVHRKEVYDAIRPTQEQ